MKQTILFLLISFSLSAQVNGVVLDSISGKPIAYASVIYENTKIGVNTDDKGNFSLLENDTIQYLEITNLGYNSKRVLKSDAITIKLSQKVYELNEIIVSAKKNNSEITVGEIRKSQTGYNNGGISHMWAKFFKYEDKFSEFKYLKEIKFITKSRVKNAKLKLRIVTKDSLNAINNDLIQEDVLVTCKKGKQIQTIDVSKYNIIFPEEGLMIAFENLIIEENKYEYNYTKEGEKGKFKGVFYEPSIKGYFNHEANVYSITNNKAYLITYKPKSLNGFHDLSVQITLTN